MSLVLARWQTLSNRSRWLSGLAALVVVYLVAEVATGHNGYVYRKAPLGIILLGVVYGSATSLGAMGLILIYRANRFINFALGALGSLVGVMVIGLVQVHGLDYWLGLPLAVVAGAVIGGASGAFFGRWFRNSPRLILLVASIGLAQLFGGVELAGSKAINFLALSGAFTPPFSVSIHIDVYDFQSSAILIVAVVPVVIAALAWFLTRTDAGVAVRAAAENSDRALLLGIPVKRLSTIVWVIAGALAALTYMLQAPFAGVTPGAETANDPTVLVPLLAAAVIARMESLPMAFWSAVGLGVLQEVVAWNWPNDPTLIYPIFLVVILVALLLQSRKLTRAEASGESSWSVVAVLKPIPDELRRVPEVLWSRRALLVVLAAAFIFLPHTWGVGSQLLAGFAVVWAMLGVSLVVLTGWAGQVSLGQFGFAGVSGMIAGNMVAHWNTDFFLVMVVAGLVGAAVSLIIGLPALRIKGQYLAAVTLAMAVALDQYFLNTDTFPQFIPTDGIKRDLLLQRFNLNDYYELYLVCLFFLFLAILATQGLRKARAGRVLIAVRDNDRAAAAASVNVTSAKLGAFAIAGVIAGVAGALDVILLGALDPGSFPSGDSITVFIYAVIGGLGSVSGALIGIFVFKYLETLTWLGDYRQAVSGVGALVVLLFLPGGVGQIVYSARDRLLGVVARRRGIIVASLVADKSEEDSSHDEAGLLATAMAGEAPAAGEVPAASGDGTPGHRREKVGS